MLVLLLCFSFFLYKIFKLKNYVVLYYKYIVVIVILAGWFVTAFYPPNTKNLTKGAVFPYSLLCLQSLSHYWVHSKNSKNICTYST